MSSSDPEHKVHGPPPLIVPIGVPNDRFIILYTKDIEDTDISLLKEYGKVLIFDPKVYVNVPLHILEFDYILLDLRRKEDRQYYSQIDKSFLDRCHVISLCYSFEKNDEIHEEIGSANILSKLPEKQAFKADFDRLLLLKKIGKPRAALSLFKSFIRLVKGDWR